MAISVVVVMVVAFSAFGYLVASFVIALIEAQRFVLTHGILPSDHTYHTIGCVI